MDTIEKLPRSTLTRFVPVIFANGEDDDLLGIIAAFENKPVQYIEKVYEPGEKIIVAFKTVKMSSYMAVEDKAGNVLLVIGQGLGAPAKARADATVPSRIAFHNCTFIISGADGQKPWGLT